MKRYTLAALSLLAIFALLPLLAFFKPESLKVSFSEMEWTAAKQQAKTENKLYFVDFDASYCAACRNMDISTYQDSRLASYMGQNVVGLRLDVQDFDGVMWSQKYEIEALPTLLIFNEEGKLVKRLVGYQSSADLLKAFEEVRSPKGSPSVPSTTTTPKQSPQPLAEEPILPPAKSPAKTNESPRLSGNLSIFEQGIQASGKGLYEVELKRQKSEGFSLQMGVYKEVNYWTLEAESLQKQLPGHKILMHVDELRGKTVYQLLLGEFESQAAARRFQNVLQQKKIRKGLIKDLRYFK
ncbi:thioredoxin fold domain-containing protein [Saprospira grandis]|uniref:Thioredoxin domain protein n=1 Tax=Saprospira grandis (strain Lewin) TaxID=984262 RepID=H6L4U1_SAPGL|nr:thioredoxin fold domain-containing protein [Saprospira grandis]AFC25116.1 thioredoxin domain protein [Saprospira grandis str. Lewin]